MKYICKIMKYICNIVNIFWEQKLIPFDLCNCDKTSPGRELGTKYYIIEPSIPEMLSCSGLILRKKLVYWH